MIIGVDCDGVLTDMAEFVVQCGEKWFKRQPVKLNSLDPSEMFNCSKLQEQLFGIRYFLPYCKKCPPRKHAAAAVKKLISDGHKVYQITARKFASGTNPLGRYIRRVHKQWLEKHGFQFSGIFFCSDSKGPADKLRGMKSVSADVMIDDRSDIALYLAKRGVKVLLFDNPYNKGVQHKNIIRVYGWKDIYRKLTELSEKGIKGNNYGKE